MSLISLTAALQTADGIAHHLLETSPPGDDGDRNYAYAYGRLTVILAQAYREFGVPEDHKMLQGDTTTNRSKP